MRLWVDVEDIFEYALHTKRPSGIQRVSYELQRAIFEIAPGSVEFIRHGEHADGFVTVPFAMIETLFENLSGTSAAGKAELDDKSSPAEKENAAATRPLTRSRRLRHYALANLPQPLYGPAIRLLLSVIELTSASAAFFKQLFSLKNWRKQNDVLPQKMHVKQLPEGIKTRLFAGDDWLLSVGSSWCFPGYAERVSDFCNLHGLRFAVLIYDIIPLRRPEWVDYGLQIPFRDWFQAILPLADAVLAISHATACDVEQYANENSLALPGRIGVIPLGTGGANPAVAVRTPRLPPRRSFALIISTIEIRKNHLLLFRIWRELIETMPWETIPTLVFAGRVGWLVQDLIQQLENTNWLNGKIMLIDDPTDPELETLYEDCMFTLYPSFYEGWGLPVTESLAHGAPCICSDRTSLPEAGGDLSVYFHPDRLAEAIKLVRGVIENPAALETWRERVQRDFKPIPWTDSARVIMDHLQDAGVARRMPLAVAAVE